MEEELLPITVKGEIVKGKQLGRTIGCPTANIKINSIELDIDEGVYYGSSVLDIAGQIHKNHMVMSYGKNVQFNEENVSLEVHILAEFRDALTDNMLEFYGSTLEITIVGFIRPMKDFGSVDVLKKAIDIDKKVARVNMEGE